MRLVKEMTIAEMSGTHHMNAPVHIKAEVRVPSAKKTSTLSLDVKTCERFGIPLSIDTACRTLVCTLESHELPLRGSRVDYQGMTKDDVNIVDFSRKEHHRFPPVTPPQRHSEISLSLNLSSFGGGDGIRPHMPPCPFYKLEIDLTEEEYRQCLELTPNTVFRVWFAMELGEKTCWPPKTMEDIEKEMQIERERR